MTSAKKETANLDSRVDEIQRLEQQLMQLKRSLISSTQSQSQSSLPVSDAQVGLLLLRSQDRFYAAPLVNVEEVVEMPSLMTLPNPVASICGMVNYHGELLAVIELDQLLGEPGTSVSSSQILAICKAGNRRFAIKADEPLDVVNVDAEAITMSDSVMPGIMRSCGVYKMDESRTAIIVDLSWLSTGVSLGTALSGDAAVPIDG